MGLTLGSVQGSQSINKHTHSNLQSLQTQRISTRLRSSFRKVKKMWIFRKVQESAESFPMGVSRFVGKNSDEISARANLLNKLHCNILTPDKIPDFFLPPRLSRRSLVAAQGIVSNCPDEPGDNCNQTVRPNSNTSITELKMDQSKETSVATRSQLKPIPFSLKNYESGLYESPNTRRKESLFHSALSRYTLERVTNRVVPKLPSIALLKVGSLESDTSSSTDSSPHSSPLPIRNDHGTHSSSQDSHHKDHLLGSKNTDSKIKFTRDNHAIQPSFSTLAPPHQLPLDMLHCQERVHSEHVIHLPRRGCIRLSASHANMSGDLATIRIRVVSVEDLREPGDLRPLHCGLTLSLSPGKLQRQHSAIIRNCRNPVFNEDFFFTEPEGDELVNFAVKVKVLEKNAGLGRAAVLGVIVKPLTELLAL